MRILVICSRYPWPARRGDQLRTVQCCELLAAEHEVTLLAPEPPPGSADPRTRSACAVETYRRARPFSAAGLLAALVSGAPFENALFLSGSLVEGARRLAAGSDLVILQLARLGGVRPLLGQVPVLMDLVDSLALNLRQRAERDRVWTAPFLRVEARRMERQEVSLVETCGASLVVSERDRLALAERVPEAARSRLRRVSIAVEPGSKPESGARGEQAGASVVFSGNLGYFVNLDAVLWFSRRVWPLLARRRPDLRFLCAGDRPPSALRRELDRGSVGLHVAPADLRSILARATVAIAPLRCGSGVPVKVLEGWAAGTPLVVSPWAAAGTEGRAGEDFLVADEPGEWVDSIERLLDDGEARRRLVESGRSRLRDCHAPEVIRGQLLEAVRAATGARE